MQTRGSYRPLVLIIDWEATAAQESSEEGCEVLRLRLRPPPGRFRDIAAWLLNGVRETIGLRRLLTEKGVTVVNVHYPGPGTFPFAILKFIGLLRSRLLFSYHGLDLTSALELTGFAKRGYEFALQQADILTACSANLAQRIREAYPQCADKTFPVLNGISLDTFEYRKSVTHSATKSNRKYLLNLATYEAKKGQDVLLQAFSRLSSDFRDYDLVMAGRDAGTRQSLIELAESLGIEDRVSVNDAVPHEAVHNLYLNASAFILPSRSEPFGLVLLEAGAHGIPVIATRVGGIPEIIVSNDLGTLVGPDSPLELETAIRDLLENSDRYLRKAEAFRDHIRNHFSWNRTCAILENLASAEP